MFGVIVGLAEGRSVTAARVLHQGDVITAVHQADHKAAARSPELVRRTKQSLRESLGLSGAEATALDLAAQEWSVGRPEFTETVRHLRRELQARRERRD